jgi:predicted DNA repair protein MutK
VSIIALLATIGVYGLVALLVRMDDAGMALMKRPSSAVQRVGRFLVAALPWVIKTLGVVGTVALLLVSGGIFHHHLPGIHEAVHALPALLTDAVLGLAGGSAVLILVTAAKRVLHP